MPYTFANTMFSEPAKELQRRNGSRAQYERMAGLGADEQELDIAETEFIAPATPTEVGIAKIWSEVLHLSRVGANMDLLKLGADSIQLFQIVARSSREGFRLTAKELLQLRTVRAVAAFVDEAANRGASEALGARKALPSLSQFQRGRRAAATTKR